MRAGLPVWRIGEPWETELVRACACFLRLYRRAMMNIAVPYAAETTTAPTAIPAVCPLWLAEESPDPEFPNTSPPFPLEEDGLDEPPPLSVPVEPDPSAPLPIMMLIVESICCVMFLTSVSSCWYSAEAGCLTCKLSVLTRSAGYVATAIVGV